MDHRPHIAFAELPFSGPENTENLPPSKIVDLLHSSRNLEQPFRRLFCDITAKEGRPRFASSPTGGAYGTLASISMWLHLPHRCTGSDEFAIPGFPERCRFHRSQLNPQVREADKSDPWSRFMLPQISLSLKSHGWLCNTVEEIEPLGLESLRTFIKLPVWSIGEHNRCFPDDGIGQRFGNEWEAFRLGGEASTRFRRERRVSTRMASGRVRRANEENQTGVDSAELGAPVGDFVAQIDCGVSEPLQSLSRGVPIVAWPLAAEQAYNSKMLREEMGVSLELPRGSESCVGEEEVKKVVDLAMDGNGKGGKMRKEAFVIKEQIRDAIRVEGQLKGSSVKALDDFLGFVLTRTEELSKSNLFSE
ncbi:UDP-glucuronosyl/UDP-glucosyltransferase [Trema orientale]|uniref:UDP-glucuronosyl/UDP-glucosyltransferase n=1 Tax=Trema orientale TaxID=63057 RepID=A0A2P5G041_TREOI|nr:UDP-glucuronosyl/UDP-glucosyltransferase [Trema orientale]